MAKASRTVQTTAAGATASMHHRTGGDSDELTGVVIMPDGSNTPFDLTSLATQATLAALLTELQLKGDLSETQPVSLASVPSHAVTGPLTDTQLRATAVPVSGSFSATPVPPVQTVVTPTITASAYSPGYVVGGAMTFSPAGLTSGGLATLVKATIIDRGNNSPPLELWLFREALVTGPGSDRTAFTPLDTNSDPDKLEDIIVFPAYQSNVNWSASNFREPTTVKSAATSFIGYLVSRGTFTPASTTDLIVKLDWKVNE